MNKKQIEDLHRMRARIEIDLDLINCSMNAAEESYLIDKITELINKRGIKVVNFSVY